MCVAPLPVTERLTATALQRRLWEDFQVEAPITDWQGRRFVRISIQAYNSVADVDRLLDGLQHLQAFTPI